MKRKTFFGVHLFIVSFFELFALLISWAFAFAPHSMNTAMGFFGNLAALNVSFLLIFLIGEKTVRESEHIRKESLQLMRITAYGTFTFFIMLPFAINSFENKSVGGALFTTITMMFLASAIVTSIREGFRDEE